MLNVLADQYLHNLQAHIPSNINLVCYDPSEGFPDDLDDINGLLVRTTNDLTPQTLPDIPPSLTFVGTASAGSDHVDTNYLRQNGITFTNAAGCNARSVAEYVATALLLWEDARDIKLTNLVVGIVGVGHVGTQVQHLLEQLGISYVSYDPPREIRKEPFSSASLDQVLDSDILTFHTPLTKNGDRPTYHWLDEDKLDGHSFELVLNSARGGVIDERALLKAIGSGGIGDIIIDTWEYEPEFDLKTADQTFIGTPHIAGYSEQAKDNATRIVVDAMLNHFGLDIHKSNRNKNARMVKKNIESFSSLSKLLTYIHPIREYEARLKDIIAHHSDERGTHFNKLRAEFPLRQEFSQTYLPESYIERYPVLEQLGFSRIKS